MSKTGMSYKEEDYLLLSGIQHFVFCRRQWALIHIENQWKENICTVEGHLMHERAHDSSIREHRRNIITVHGLRVSSSTLGVSGQCDVVEYHEDPNGIPLRGKDGLWLPYPIEYKRGKPKDHDADRLQLCGEAMCLEEMLACDIPEGALFYGEIRRREVVQFTTDFRQRVKNMLDEMHQYYKRGYTPKAKIKKECRSCSLNNLCIPQMAKMQKVETYLIKAMEDY